MTVEEVNEVMEWIARDIKDLPLDEVLVIQMAMCKMCEMVKPIYDKHNVNKFLINGKEIK